MKKLYAIALLLAAGCSSAHRGAESNASPAPLGSCESRIMDFDGAEVVVTSNVDTSLASVEIVKAPNAAARSRAVDDAIHAFGPVKRDTRVMTRQSKWGLTTLTDPCGRPVALPSPH
ncbi:MAG TPA: hypothetical protein VN603_12335 [Candidatus Acidoferrales bacterium]|nr:hypothetical protein [Candidatus Acidoferrales bacterium]